MIYFTSDLHFGHENVIGFTRRPFSSAGEMDQALIQSRIKAKLKGLPPALHRQQALSAA